MVNDRLGHDIGHDLLVAVAHRLHGCVSGRVTSSPRMGGDEFVFLVEDPGRDELCGVAEAIPTSLQTPNSAE